MQKDELDAFDLPDTPGVYFFRGAKNEILYIGKATSLRDRARSYFATDLIASRGERIVQMVADARTITFEPTDSVLEALILEANLIKKNQPPANSQSRDNKSFNYLVITKEEFPRVIIVRGRQLFQDWKDSDIKYLFGPFPHGGALRDAMKLVRKIFPFRDKCAPPLDGKTGKPCFNRQIGLCPGVCTGEISAQDYNRVIHHIVLLFSGKKKALLKELESDMKKLSKDERFEEAVSVRRQVAALTHINDVALIHDEHRISTGGGGERVECYDVAHTSGTETVGVMVVLQDGETAKSQYRKFKLKDVGNDDTKALAQILSRRLTHNEWPMPRVIVVDGGKGQVNAAQKVLADFGIMIPVIGVVKDERHRPKGFVGDAEVVKEYERAALLADAEAHRFAISWHRTRRSKASGLTK